MVAAEIGGNDGGSWSVDRRLTSVLEVLKGALDKVICKPDDIFCWVSLLALPLCLLKTFRLRSNLECKSAIKRQRQEESIVNAIRSWGTSGGSLQLLRETLTKSSPTFLDGDDDDLNLGERNIKQCKRKICDGHYTAAVRVISSFGVAPYNEATLEDNVAKISLGGLVIGDSKLLGHTPWKIRQIGIKSFPRGMSCGRDGLRAQHLMDCLTGAAIAISDELISSITQVVNLFLAGNYPQMLGEYIASAPLTPLVKLGGGICPIAVGTVWRRLVSKVSAIMIGHSLDGYLDGLQFIVGVAGESEAILHSVNRLIEAYGGDVGLLMLLVDFKNAFNLVDREVMLREVHLRYPAISRWVEFCYSNLARLYYGEHTLCLSLHAWYLEDGTIIGDTVVVGKVLELIMEDGPGCGLHLNVDKTEVFWPKEDPRSRLTGIFPPNIARPLHGVKLLGGPASVDFNFCNELVMKRVAKTIGLMDAIAKINDPQCKLLLLRSCTGISRLYFTTRTCPPSFFESAQRSFDVALRSSLKCIVTASGLGFGDWQWRLATLPFAFGGLGVYSAGDVLNYAFLASRLQSAGFQTKLLCHTGIVSLGPTFDDALFVFNTSMENDLLSNSSSKPCSAYSKVFAGDIYGDHDVSCAGIIGIKHRHNVVCDTLVDICYRSGISVGKEVDIEDGDFVPGQAVIDVAQRKRGKYMDMCAANGYGFLPFSFSSLGELEADAVTLLKRIRKFSITQDIRARAAIHIFNRISFAIAKGVGAQIVSRLPSNFFVNPMNF
ncbi:hypothetical protein Tco_0083707 [Tanacetum coccineum]